MHFKRWLKQGDRGILVGFSQFSPATLGARAEVSHSCRDRRGNSSSLRPKTQPVARKNLPHRQQQDTK